MIMLGARGLSSRMCRGMQEPGRFLDNLAKGHVRAYVKLLPEPTTIEGVKLAVSQSSASTIHGQERRNVCMIELSVDSFGEVAGRATHWRPPVEFDVLKKLVQ